MAIVAGTLIREAYILASVLGQFDEPEGFYALSGINLLNDIITQWGAIGIYAPYNDEYVFETEANKKNYTLSPVVSQIMEAKCIQQDSYPNDGASNTSLRIATDKDYYLFNDYSTSRPSWIYLDRRKVIVDEDTDILGSRFILNPTPGSVYTINVLLKYHMQVTTLFDELTEFPDYYIKPLRYQLAKDMSAMYKTNLPQSFWDEYEKLIMELKATNPSDLTIQNENPFRRRRAFKPTDYYGYY